MKNKKGSALLWAIAVIMVLTVAVAGALTISYSYYNRSIRNNNARQSYLTSKGVIEDIVENIESNNTEYLTMIKSLKEGESTTFTVNFNGENVGQTTGQIAMLPKEETKGLLTVTVKTVFAEETHVIKADMQLGNVGGLQNWQLLRYYNSDEVDVVSNNNSVALDLYTHAATVLQLYNQNRNFSDVLPFLQEDTEGWANYAASKDYTNLTYMNNTNLRRYYRYRNENGLFDTFNINEINVKTVIDPLTNETVVLSESNYLKNTLYIQPFLCNSSYDTVFVYANGVDAPGNFSGGIHLVYDAGHWYYIGKVMVKDFQIEDSGTTSTELKATHFDDSSNKTQNNYARDRWERFKTKYLKEENRVI